PHHRQPEFSEDPIAPALTPLQNAPSALDSPNPIQTPVTACPVPDSTRGMSLPCLHSTTAQSQHRSITWTGSQLRRGGCAIKKCREASAIRADGVVLIKFDQIRLTNTTPSAPTRWLRTFSSCRGHPSSAEEGDFPLT